MKHTPMERRATLVYIPGGGFDVGGCPEPEELAALIVRACNAHDELVAALKVYINEFEDDAKPSTESYLKARAALAKAEGQ